MLHSVEIIWGVKLNNAITRYYVKKLKYIKITILSENNVLDRNGEI